ncbi:MAG TPA: class II fructose-bisphosphate aldolase [Desulfomonilia bacterium]
MSLKNNSDLLNHAASHGYAVGAFNVNNIEQIRAVLETAVEEKAPVIVAVTESAVRYAGWPLFSKALTGMADASPVPVSVHFDHGETFESVVMAIMGGFTSVMYDCSKLPLAENAAQMRRVVAVARSEGVSVEGEIGHVGGKDAGPAEVRDEEILTDPDDAARFAEESMVDSLAVAVGTVHGMRKQTAKIDLERISAIASAVKVPLVLHGASGVPDDIFKEVIRRGIRKINIGAELQKSFTAGVREYLAENTDAIDIRKIFKPGIDNMKEAVRKKMRLFGSSGQAW